MINQISKEFFLISNPAAKTKYTDKSYFRQKGIIMYGPQFNCTIQKLHNRRNLRQRVPLHAHPGSQKQEIIVPTRFSSLYNIQDASQNRVPQTVSRSSDFFPLKLILSISYFPGDYRY